MKVKFSPSTSRTFEYRARQRATFPSFELARNLDDLRERVKILFQAPDRAGQFYRKLFSDIFHYAAMRVPEIADDIVSIDNAMKWGFGWEMGPFELWDARGVERIIDDWVREKRPIPPLVESLRVAGGKSFYNQKDGIATFFDGASAGYRPLPERPGVIPGFSALGLSGSGVKLRGFLLHGFVLLLQNTAAEYSLASSLRERLARVRSR